jgi:small subunit ribosomal protein S2
LPVVAPLDTNCDPDVVDYPIPGNDDAIRSIQLFCKEMCEAINEGKELRAQDEEVEVAEPASEEEKKAIVEEASSEEEEAKEEVSEEKEEEK